MSAEEIIEKVEELEENIDKIMLENRELDSRVSKLEKLNEQEEKNE